MKRILLFLILAVASRFTSHAQAYDGKFTYQKTQQAVAIIELPYTQDVVEDGIKDYMAKKGFKGASAKGFTVFRAIKMDDNSTDPNDLYFKIDRKSRQEKDITVITLLPTKPNQDILARSPSPDSSDIGPAKAFLNTMAPALDAHNTDVQVASQQEVVKKALKKMSGLQDDQSSLEKKIRNLQSDLAENKADQVKQTAIMQDNVHSDEDALKKAHKKMDKLLDNQSDMEKKLRKAQNDLDQNKKDQDSQQAELQKQQQILDAVKAKQKS